MALGALFVFLGKLAGAAKEMAIAWRYGVSEIVDAYLYVLTLMSWPIAVWFAALVLVLVPLAATIREKSPHELPQFRAELFGMTLLLGSALWFVAEIGFRIGLRSSVSGLSGPALQYALEISPILSSVLVLGMPISLFSVWMQSARYHENTLFEAVPALVLLLVLLFAPSVDAQTLLWGTVAGFGCQLAALAAWLVPRGEWDVPRFTLQSDHWKAFMQGFGIMVAGQALMGLTSVVDQLFAARIGPGAISTLSYGNRVVALIIGLGGTTISRATLPVFSQAEAKGSEHVARIAVYWTNLLLLIGSIAVVCGWLLAPWGVAALFERGAFTAKDTRAVTEILRYGLFQVPFFFSFLVLVSVVSSRHQYSLLFMSGVIGLIAKLVSNAVLIRLMGINGLVTANVVVYGINFGFLALAVRFGSGKSLIQERT